MTLTPFQVLVRDLPTHRELDLPASFVAEATRGLAMREALGVPAEDPNAGAGHLKVDLYSEGAHVFANGQIAGHVTVACSRCIEPVVLSFDEPVHVTFLPVAEFTRKTEAAAAAEEDEDGVSITEDDLDLFGYDGETLDLEPLVREQFVLAVPYAPLCSETCAGLCPQCGVNRNETPCACEGSGDPRLAGLKALKFPS